MNRLRAFLHNRPRLDFVVAGAQKSGTTALFAYLRRVPGIYMPFRKGLHYFHRDDLYGNGSDFSGMHKWLLLSPRGAIIGEASSSYLKNPGCFSRVYDYNPDIKFIAILRSPVLRAYSAWNYKHLSSRDKRDFLTAVRVEVESGGDVSVARENKYGYVHTGRYAEQIRQAQRIFPRENLMFLKYEDFTRDQIAHVRDIVRFIGGPEDVDIPRIRRANVRRYDRPLTEAEFETVLELYEDDIRDVEALTGWDCSDWRAFARAGK